MSFRYCSYKFFVLAAASILIAVSGMSESQPDRDTRDEMGTLVTTEWLSQHLDDPDIVVIDCTVSMVPKEGGGFQSVT